MLTVVYAVFIVASTVVFGLWSDRVQRRKVFVIVSGAVTGLGALILALVPTWPGALAGAVVFGIGYGVYLSVDFALCTEVLPTARGPRQGPRGDQHRRRAAPGLRAVRGLVPGRVRRRLRDALRRRDLAVCLLGSVFVRNIHGVR